MFNTVPYNSFPASTELLRKLDEVVKAIDDMPTFTSNDKVFLDKLPAFPSADGVKVLTATTESSETTLSYEEIENELPTKPSADGVKVLTATTESGETVLSWEEPTNISSYSTTEQKTGQKWTNGKDIYFKTFDILELPNATTIRIPTGLVNLDKVIKIEGIAYGNDTHNPLPFVSTSVQYSIECWVDDSANIVVTSGANYSSYSGVVTIYYTKTS